MITASDDWAKRPINLVRTGPRGGAPVILGHPVELDLSYWDRQIDALRGTYGVVAFDLPGHGIRPTGCWIKLPSASAR